MVLSHTPSSGNLKFIFLPLDYCVIQGKLLYLSVPPFLISKGTNYITYLGGVVVKHQEYYLTDSYCLMNIDYFYVTALFCNITVFLS